MPRKTKLKVHHNDSIAPVAATPETLKTVIKVDAPVIIKKEQPLFQSHQLKRTHINAQYSERFTPDWLTFTIITIVALFTWYRQIYHRMLIQLINAFFSMATTNQIVRDESVLLQKASFNASVFAYLVGGVFLYQVSIAYGWQNYLLMEGFIRFILFAFVIALLFSFQMIALRLLSTFFKSEKPVSTYIFTIFLFNLMAGLVLLPLVILIAYAPVEYRMILIRIGLIILALIFLYRVARVFIIWTTQLRAPVFYLFLYLCAVEFAPLLLIGKIALIQELAGGAG